MLTENFQIAKDLVAEERETLLALRASELKIGEPTAAADIDCAMVHIEYLDSYWLREALWQSWARWGRIEAAKRLGCEINEVVPTTNHLESFNGVLKRRHLVRWQQGKRRLRMDVLIHVLVFNILPSIFRQRRIEDLEQARSRAKLSRVPGGEAILERQATSRQSVHVNPTAYLSPDPSRDSAAQALIANKQVSVPSISPCGNTFTFDCYSSLAIPQDRQPILY